MNYFKKPELISRLPKDFSKIIELKDDHKYKPVIAIKHKEECPRNILETFTDYYKEIVEFLVAIGEPIVRTKNFQEYEINSFSLYSAASMGIDTDDIIHILENISKNYLQEELKKYIIENTKTYGIARIILKNNRYFIKCKTKEILKKISEIQEVKYSNKKVIDLEKKKPKKMEIEENFQINDISNEKKGEIPPEGEGYI